MEDFLLGRVDDKTLEIRETRRGGVVPRDTDLRATEQRKKDLGDGNR